MSIPPWPFIERVENVAEQTIRVGNEDRSFILLADLREPHASPEGWWLVYAWTSPELRGTHLGTRMLEDAFATIDVAPLICRRPDRKRHPRYGTWSGRYGYVKDDRDWHLLTLSTRNGYQLFSVPGGILSTVDERRTDEQPHSVIDKSRRIEFTGRLLGESSTAAPGKDRWSEIAIYRTQAGRYVVAGVGRSRRTGETDRHWAHVCEEPSGVFEVLNLIDNHGTKYIPYNSRLALEQAQACDDDLRRAMLVETVE